MVKTDNLRGAYTENIRNSKKNLLLTPQFAPLPYKSNKAPQRGKMQGNESFFERRVSRKHT